MDKFLTRELDVRKMEWISALAFSSLVLVSVAIFIPVEVRAGLSTPALFRARVAQLCTAFAGVLLLLIFRKRSTRGLTVAVFLAVFLPFYPISAMNHFASVRLHTPWAPFPGYKGLFLGLSVLVPGPFWINVALMAGIALEAVGLWFGMDVSVRSGLVTGGEPWLTLIYGLVSSVLLVIRYYFQKTVRELALSQAKEEILEKLSRVFLSVRDLTNTPLQSLGIASELLRRNHPAAQPINERIESSILRLARLNRIFRCFDERVSWADGDLLTEDEIVIYLKTLETKLEELE